jgi:predicted nucleotidyltransferase
VPYGNDPGQKPADLKHWTSIRSIGHHVPVTLLDETARVPQLRADAIAGLAEALDREGVVAAMLIGSQARGTAGPLSDVDIAVWHALGLGATSLSLRLALASAASRALGTDEVDVLMLNEAPPLLRHRAIRDARRIVDRDPKARVRLEARALLDYLDTKPLRAELSRGLRHRIEEGRFGRPRER